MECGNIVRDNNDTCLNNHAHKIDSCDTPYVEYMRHVYRCGYDSKILVDMVTDKELQY